MNKLQKIGFNLSISELLNLQQKYWQQTNRISTSLNSLICKKLTVNADFELKSYMKDIGQIDNFLNVTMRISSKRNIVVQWVNCILLNVVAFNDEYKQQMQEQISIHSYSHTYSSNDSQTYIKMLEKLAQNCGNALFYLFNMQSIKLIIKHCESNPSNSIHKLYHQNFFTLVSTINYLSNKLKIALNYENDLQIIMEMLTSCDCQCCQREIQQNVRINVNSLIFGILGENQSHSIESLLNQNYNVSIVSIASLIDANYYPNTQRQLFRGCKTFGIDAINTMISVLTRKYEKNQIFSEKMSEIQPVFTIFFTVIEFRHLNLYVFWLSIIQLYINTEGESTGKEEEIVGRILRFLQYISIQNEQFAEVLKTIYSQLTGKNKYNHTISVQIIKKFILNRFLLNPHLFQSYSHLKLTQQMMSNFFNRIRMYFYPKKCHHSIRSYSQKIQNTLVRIISNSASERVDIQASKSVIDTGFKKKHFYQLNRTLLRDYETLYGDIFEKYGQGKQSKKSNTSYQLSFSFVKNNNDQMGNKSIRSPQSKFSSRGLISPRIEINTQKRVDVKKSKNKIENQNFNSMNILSPKSQKSRKTDISEVPLLVEEDMNILQYLVIKRRALGTARKAIEEKAKRRREKRQKANVFFHKIHKDFQLMRKQLEASANRLRLQIQLM